MSSPQQRFSAEDRRQQILDAATDLFAQQGYNGTTTREIAARASVNEAIIFRHFESKEDLYWAILDRKTGTKALRETLLKQLRAPLSERDKFAAIAEGILRRRAEDPSLTRLLLFSALEHHQLSGKFFQTYTAEYYETLADYIRTGIAEGKFRKVDPIIAARGFLGMVVYHFLVQHIFGGNAYQQFDVGQVSREIVSLWLDGMLASKKHAPASSKKHSNGRKRLPRVLR
jgi:AcrR family transcriptional regulator